MRRRPTVAVLTCAALVGGTIARGQAPRPPAQPPAAPRTASVPPPR
ncbi:MAG: hypothetical protein ACKOZU_00875 [Planctomycetaceae bacterium]